MSLDNFKKQTITWDMINQAFEQPIQIMEGDVNARTLLLKITDNGSVLDLTGYSVKLTYQYMYKSQSGFIMLTPNDISKGEFTLIIPTEMTVSGLIKSNLILLNEDKEQVIVSKNLTFISDDSTVTSLTQEVNNKIDDFTKLLLENMPQVMRSELNDLHAQTESNKSNIELKANLADMTSLQSAMTELKNEVEAFGISHENLVTIKSLLDAIARNASESEVVELINSVKVLTSNISLMSNGDYSPKANQTDLESLQSAVNNQSATISTKANQTDLDDLQTDLQTKVNAIYSNALADHTEIVNARGGQSSLDVRLDGLDAKYTDLENDYEQNKKIETLIKHGMYDYIVDINGTGDFTSVAECVKQAADLSTIYIKNGLYENEIVKAWLKTVFIVGESRDGVIITNSTGEYATPPVEMGTGLLRNLTIYAKDPGGLTPKNKGYALHSESSVYNYYKFEVDNCNIISDWRQSWGMGMRGGMVYNARNVNFDGGVYFHDNEHANGTVQRIFFDTCNMTREDTNEALIMQDQQMSNADIDVRFNRCFIKSLQGTEILFFKWDTINTNVIPATGFVDFPSWGLNSFSWGNSEAALNA
ncbi:BppU family phage baseplate upper protein [Lactococcus lactis subsp. lactis]|uniref:BppU family phage baseplate upper protein n=2 Tax=Lactococcus lactis TaxID=1358 RepID=A0AAJ4JVP0_LACLL|nr:BppU family phage baseplate upper protein [Lactococcus lactis]QRZ34787.1 BppU family phage baseplate upper protein [Lactococcus lactis subsp. lactis]